MPQQGAPSGPQLAAGTAASTAAGAATPSTAGIGSGGGALDGAHTAPDGHTGAHHLPHGTAVGRPTDPQTSAPQTVSPQTSAPQTAVPRPAAPQAPGQEAAGARAEVGDTPRDGADGGFMPQPGGGGPRAAGARSAGAERSGGDQSLPPEQPHPQTAAAHQPPAALQPQAGAAPHAPTGPFAAQPQPQPQPQPQAQPQPQPQAQPSPDLTAHGQGAGPGNAAAPQGAWQQYDPWSAPQHGGPAGPPPGARRSRRATLAIGAVVLALLAGGVGGGIGAYIERNGGLSDIELPQAAGEQGGRNPESVAGIAQTALPGVVTLHVRGSAEQGTGTGFVLDRQGHILTNNHVVEPAGTGGEISVTFSGGQTAKAKVIGQDGGYDLAVVQVEGVTGLRPLALGNSDTVRVGDPVVAIGAPYDLANTVTAGIISAKQRPITAGGEKGDGSDVSYVDALQTDAPINPGNSGGPLVDAKARVIGINSAIRAADSGNGLDGGAQGGSIGLGFAIPINQAKRVAEELINTGRATHPVIGVTLEMDYTGDGARVSARSKDAKAPVTPGGPGAKAGIRPGDVITEVDGAPVHGGEELIVKIRSHRPGDSLLLTVERDGEERSVRLTLGSSSTD
ncbi:trypsin-like peptidase domain-containing protein [Streptomyces sp. Pv4-95]